jgi:type IV secretory pathway TraG/TraD family ATPase VirD4
MRLSLKRPRRTPYHASLDTPLLRFGKDVWRIRDAAEGTAIWGAPGSGKSSGSGRALARAFLAAGMGGLVLCAKPEEADIWRGYAKAARRERDVTVIDASGAERFNLLDYAAAHLGGRGFEQNLVELMGRMAEAARIADSGGGSDGENRFFIDAAMKWLSHAFPLLLTAYGTLRLRDLNRFIASAPQSPAEAGSEAWITGSFCSHTLMRVGELAKQAMDRGEQDSYALQVVAEHGDFFLDEVPRLDNRPRSSIEATLTNLTYPFLSGKLAELFCTTTTLTPAACREGRIIVMDLPVLSYGAAGAVAQTLFKYLFGLAMQRERVEERGRPVFLFADEAQFFLNSADADLLSTARSSKTCIVYITQDLPTYYARLGRGARDVAESILSKFGTRIFHANSSRETNQAAAELIGKVEKFHLTRTRSRGRSSGAGGNRHDEGGGFHGQDGSAVHQGESTSGYLDYELPPDYFATRLRTGSREHGRKVDGIVIRNGRLWRRTGRHWVQAEFRQR